MEEPGVVNDLVHDKACVQEFVAAAAEVGCGLIDLHGYGREPAE